MHLIIMLIVLYLMYQSTIQCLMSLYLLNRLTGHADYTFIIVYIWESVFAKCFSICIFISFISDVLNIDSDFMWLTFYQANILTSILCTASVALKLAMI